MACVRRRRGRWVVDFRDQHGKRQWKAFRTRQAADNYLADSVPKVTAGTFVAPTAGPTFSEAADKWLTTKQDRRQATVTYYTGHVEEHLKPYFGKRRLFVIRAELVDAFKADRLKAGLAPVSVNKLLGTAAQIFAFGRKRGWCGHNPLEDVERCRRSATVVLGTDADPERTGRAVDPREVLTATEMQQLIDAAPSGFDRTFLEVACFTGARVGELTALTWDDVDFDGGFLHIRRSLSWAKPYGEKKRARPRFYEPKTATSKRSIRLLPSVLATLKRWKLACPPSPHGLVFPTVDGEPKHRSVISHLVLKPALKAAKLPARVTPHGLRHSCASALLAAGVPITEVSALLGHATPNITMEVYAHWVRRHDSNPMEKLAAAMRGSSLVAGGVAGTPTQAVSA